ncbi:AAA family ATPase [Massilia sp. W12]|uniref:AAA family ATPase n=1 Tax=Massilia sp. W12 TaxID=3126507 RepID=UPI0030CBD989
MLKKLVIENFRGLDHLAFCPEQPCTLLLGKNGAGKSSLIAALAVLQAIGRGESRTGELFDKYDLPVNDAAAHIVLFLQYEAPQNGGLLEYCLKLSLPPSFKEVKVCQEYLHINGAPVFNRNEDSIELHQAKFTFDWHQIALLSISPRQAQPVIEKFISWLAHMILLAPAPALIKSEATEKGSRDKYPLLDGSNLADWYSALQMEYSEAMETIRPFLKQRMPDYDGIIAERAGPDVREIKLRFKGMQEAISLARLSDGEKCFVAAALVLAACKHYGPLLCVWDEPDNFLAYPDVSHFLRALRDIFNNGGGQFLATTHNLEAMHQFTLDEILVLQRESHASGLALRKLADLDDDAKRLYRSLPSALKSGLLDGEA